MDISLTIPGWILWGVGIAFMVTFGLLIIASFIAVSFTALTGGWLGGDQPWKHHAETFKAFLIIGLPVGLSSSYAWSHVNPWVGVVVGIVVLAAIWIAWALYNKWRVSDRRLYRNYR
jgi:hypothetical protein